MSAWQVFAGRLLRCPSLEGLFNNDEGIVQLRHIEGFARVRDKKSAGAEEKVRL